MIFPYLLGFLSPNNSPITWAIFSINILIFFSLAPIENQLNRSLTATAGSSEMLKTQGNVYFQYLENKKITPQTMDRRALGKMALKDPIFMSDFDKYNYKGDQIAINHWKEELTKFNDKNRVRPVTVFGLNSQGTRWTHWITYQFMHSGFVHLVGNMILLLLFGSAIENLVGSLVVMFVYLAGGILGAMFFVEVIGLTTAPLVGASAAVTALIGFYPLVESRKKIPFLYFLSPFKGYWGLIYLPTMVIYLFFVIPDIASYLSAPPELSTVAHAAHIGGAMFGIMAGWAMNLSKKFLTDPTKVS